MKTIIFLETNKSGSSRDAIRAAEELGYYTVLFTSRKKFIMQREEFCDVHEMVLLNTRDTEQMLEYIDRLQIQGKVVKGVISFIDSLVSVAMELSEQLGLEGFTLASTKVMEDKILTRKALKESPANVQFAVYDHSQTIDEFINSMTIEIPCIVKSPASTGSKDVHLVETIHELNEVMNQLKVENPQTPILVEEYIDGQQWLIEAIVQNGDVDIIAIIGQEITKQERFIITGYYSLLDLDAAILASLKETLTEIIRAMGMMRGSCHFELRRVDKQWKLIEVNPRISGGAMNSMILYSLGINLVEQTLRLYLGLPVDVSPTKHEFVYTHYLTILTRGSIVKIAGKNRASRADGVREVYIKPRKGMLVHPPTSMGHRYGYIIAAAETKEKAKHLAISAAKEIQFYIEEQR
ncbi:ATP-grasp domain-containing protein [Bacillus pinisoli]|uniref:ATP-grasp domain-containing protein n=1 Tax=Bacillus pinisoli TaxID=2901866 RepID=UPI001FF3FEF2|nr:ATP-grasp domain-containing protein [Bacillus pinisoli]